MEKDPGEGPYSGKGKWEYIDKRGEIVIKIQFDDANPFFQGLASVGINGKYG